MRIWEAGRLASFGLVMLALLGLPSPAVASPGDLDETFAGDGVIEGSVPVAGEAITSPSVAVGPDGKPVVAGVGGLARYEPDGGLDPTFSADGIRDLTVDATDVAIGSDGSIYVAYFVPTDGNSPPKAGVLRLKTDGTLDSSFAGDGSAESAISIDGYLTFSPPQLQVDAAGRIVVTASKSVVRFSSDGSPDSTFAGDGRRDLEIRLDDAVVRANNSLVMAGASIGSFPQLYLVSLTEAGELDPSFGSGGVVERYIGGYGGADFSIALDSQRRVLASFAVNPGPVAKCPCPTHEVIRFGPNGDPDPTFDSPGSYFAATGVEIAIDRGGHVLASGIREFFPAPEFALSRLNAGGELDRPFGRFGIAGAFFGFDQGVATDLAIAADGDIFVAGFHDDAHVLARFEGGGQKPDADADGIRDRKDKCPYRFAEGASGCPIAARELTFSRDGQTIEGTLESVLRQCETNEPIKIIEVTPGVNRVIKVIESDGGQDGGTFQARIPVGSRHLTALAAASLVRGQGKCQRARSDEA